MCKQTKKLGSDVLADELNITIEVFEALQGKAKKMMIPVVLETMQAFLESRLEDAKQEKDPFQVNTPFQVQDAPQDPIEEMIDAIFGGVGPL